MSRQPVQGVEGMEGAGKRLIIAIDGPVGSGKSTVARVLAKRLGYRYIDSGAMYRALAWKALEAGLDLNDEQGIGRLAEATVIALEPAEDRDVVLVDGKNVSRQIRERGVEEASSKISTLPRVRRVMVAQQQAMAAQGGVVMDGRDIGTVVFPRADVKFYLVASLEVRATRRYLQAQASGLTRDPDELIREIRARDERDMGRSASPLRKAEDAVTIDTTALNALQVVAAMEEGIRRRVTATKGSQ